MQFTMKTFAPRIRDRACNERVFPASFGTFRSSQLDGSSERERERKKIARLSGSFVAVIRQISHGLMMKIRGGSQPVVRFGRDGPVKR